jgi:hypothetical protein
MTEGAAAGDSAVLVIRVWHEAKTPQGFRARVLYQGAADEAPTASTAVSDPEGVLVAVRQWLSEHT